MSIKQILDQVLTLTNTEDVHSYMHEKLVQLGLGDFVHARLQSLLIKRILYTFTA